MKLRNRILLAAVATMGAMFLGGCDDKKSPTPPAPVAATGPATGGAKVAPPETAAKHDAAPATTGAKKSYVIGVIAKSQSNPVFQAAHTGAEDAAKDLSAKLGVDIKINWRTPTSEDAQQQAQFVEQLVAAGVNGISLSCTDAKVLTSAINAAADKGVPTITFDSDAPDSKRLAYYGMDDYNCGKLLAKEIAGQLNLSPKTVSVHRDHIKEKLEFATSAEMIRQAVRYVETEQMDGASE